MSLFSSPNFLRNVLWADAASCMACGLLQVFFTGPMIDLLGLPAGLLAYSGEFLLLYGAAVAFLAMRKPPPPAVVWRLVIGNVGWALACVAVLLGGGMTPTGLGKAYVAVQALTVAVLAELQCFALRQGRARLAG